MTARALIRRGLKPGGLIGDGVRRIPVRFGAGVGRPGRVEGLKFLDALLMADASLIPHLREILREQSLELTFEFRRLSHDGSPFAIDIESSPTAPDVYRSRRRGSSVIPGSFGRVPVTFTRPPVSAVTLKTEIRIEMPISLLKNVASPLVGDEDRRPQSG